MTPKTKKAELPMVVCPKCGWRRQVREGEVEEWMLETGWPYHCDEWVPVRLERTNMRPVKVKP